jgi:flagellar protein FlbT
VRAKYVLGEAWSVQTKTVEQGMGRSHQIRMARGERLYVNGTVLRFDRSVGVQAKPDAIVLDERHIMHAGDVTSPLRQLYFCVQLVLIDPDNIDELRPILDVTRRDVGLVYQDTSIGQGLRDVGDLFQHDRYYDALLAIEAMFAEEAALSIRASLPESTHCADVQKKNR